MPDLANFDLIRYATISSRKNGTAFGYEMNPIYLQYSPTP